MDLSNVVFGEGVNSLDSMSRREQADVLTEFYADDDNVVAMLTDLFENGGDDGVLVFAAFVRDLQQAFRSDLTKSGREAVPFPIAMQNLGRQLLNHAHRYAEQRINDYIDNNWDQLVWESNQKTGD